MIYREYSWNGFKCTNCHGLLPQPDHGTGDISQCLDCGYSTDVSSLVKVLTY